MGKEIHGKLSLDEYAILMPCERKIDAEVYIHVRDYARARVSHLDVEKMGLGGAIRRGRGNFLEVRGVENGLEVVLREKCQIILGKEEFTVSSIVIASPLLNEIARKVSQRGLGLAENTMAFT